MLNWSVEKMEFSSILPPLMCKTDRNGDNVAVFSLLNGGSPKRNIIYEIQSTKSGHHQKKLSAKIKAVIFRVYLLCTEW